MQGKLLLNVSQYFYLFINRAAMGRARFLLCTGFLFFSFLCHQTQTSADDVFINQSQAKLPLGQMSSPNDVIISQLQAISQLFSSYLPSGKFCLVSELNIHSRGEIIGRKSLGVGRQDICKDKECNLGPVAGYYG